LGLSVTEGREESAFGFVGGRGRPLERIEARGGELDGVFAPILRVGAASERAS
jgi:hypothetical protein